MRSANSPPTRAVPTSIRQWNERVVVRSLRGAGALRVAEIAARTGLTPGTLRQVLQGLADKDWVHVHASTTTGRGRPARLFSLNFPQAWMLGLDVGAHVVRGVRLRLDGTREAAEERQLPYGASDRERHRLVGSIVDQLCEGIDRDDIWMTGLAVGGSLTEDGVVQRSVAIPGWDGQRPLELYADVIPGRGLLLNDVFAATLAEHVAGAAQGANEVLFVHLGRRPTFGILLGGDVHRGAHGTAGDMSKNQLLAEEGDPPWMQQLVRGADVSIDDDLADSIRHYVRLITPRLALAAALIDPEVMVIAGTLAPHAHLYLDELQSALSDQLQAAPRVTTSKFDQFGSAEGAAQLALRTLDQLLVNEDGPIAALRKASLIGPTPAHG